MNTEQYLQAWNRGQLCLHPTDTLPGLSFNPFSQDGRSALVRFKQRDEGKPFIGLTGSPEQAFPYWQPLPLSHRRFLKRLWPAPVSVVWNASDAAPATMVSAGGEIAIRCPVWSPENRWMQELLLACGTVFPTTSVNISGTPAAETWEEAVEYLRDSLVCIPGSAGTGFSAGGGKPSTVIRLSPGEDAPEILREGATESAAVQSLWNNTLNHQEN